MRWVLVVCGLVFGDAVWAEQLKTARFTSTETNATRITGLLLQPEGQGPFPAVVMMHGCSGLWDTSGKLRQRPAFWSQWLRSHGFVVLMADSFHPRGHGSICSIKDRPVLPERERPFDAYGALAYLQGRADVKPDRVALMGWSNGAMALLWTIQSDTEARPSALTHDFRAAIGFYPGCTKIGKAGFATHIPTLLQLGAKDDWTPPGPCLRMVATAHARSSPIAANLYPGAYHNFDHPTKKVRTLVTRNSVHKKGEKRVHSGRNKKAREAAITNVERFLRRQVLDQ